MTFFDKLTQNSPYVIAELSGNHQGRIDNALSLIEAAKDAGASAVKLQTYTADTLTIDHDSSDFMIDSGPWAGYKLYDLYKEASTPWEWHEDLFKKAHELGLDIFSSPFDETAVDFLESLNTPLYKIASFEITDHNLLAYVASKRKPIILSTGMATFKEIEEALTVITSNGCSDIALLHCISAYPAKPEDYNLNMIRSLKERFNVVVGLSDHTLGATIPIASVAMGAKIIEKHFTLSRAAGGVDAAFSAEPSELKAICEAVKTTWLALGTGEDKRASSELQNMIFRRSIYPTKNIMSGETFTKENIKCIRPGFSLPTKYYKIILGKTAKTSINKGDRLSFEDMD